MKIENVVLPHRSSSQRYNIEYRDKQVLHITPCFDHSDEPPSMVLPALCHPHIHLDKAYLLTSNSLVSGEDHYPDYSDLALESGDFQEALTKTSEAKTRYTVPDLVLRGSQLIAESIRAGATSMRAFVEVDHVTRFKCLDAAVQLKERFDGLCYVQICAFAQDPIKSTQYGKENLQLLLEAIQKYSGKIEVLGTTPYVEETIEAAKENISLAIEVAISHKLHLDFHLDYNLVEENEPMVWEVMRALKRLGWVNHDKNVVLGHCSRLTLFSVAEWRNLAEEAANLRVSFVGLPTSDLFMMGRPDAKDACQSKRPRGTLQVIDMIKQHHLQACIGVNNVGNAFTPWGNADPLRLASLGVGLYQAGTAEHARILYQCVSTRARRAIGLQETDIDDGHFTTDFNIDENYIGDLLVVKNEHRLWYGGEETDVPARQRVSVTDVVWDPPDFRLRSVARDASP